MAKHRDKTTQPVVRFGTEYGYDTVPGEDKYERPSRRKTGQQWYERPEFLALRRKWYGRLSARGHMDIEHIDWRDGSTGPMLKGFSRMDAVRFWSPDVEEYYYRATHFLPVLMRRQWARTDKIDARDVKIWRRHAAGKSDAKVARALGICRETVAKRRKRLQAMFREWLLTELSEHAADRRAHGEPSGE